MDSLGLLHPSSILSLAGIGVAAGFVAGLLGIGGGVLIVPLLLTVLRAHGVDPRVVMHLTVGTSLGVVLANSIAGTLTHRAAGNVASRGLPALALASVAGAFAGARAAAAVAGQDLQRVFGGFMLLVAARFLLGRGGRAEAADAGAPVTSAPLLGGIGALGGFVSAFFAVCGGAGAV
ncbi:MAG: TSUP family transporter, partial [Myxococcales bacterium]|nr:TSUP family transporter [Myxococcales bacterium]